MQLYGTHFGCIACSTFPSRSLAFFDPTGRARTGHLRDPVQPLCGGDRLHAPFIHVGRDAGRARIPRGDLGEFDEGAHGRTGGGEMLIFDERNGKGGEGGCFQRFISTRSHLAHPSHSVSPPNPLFLPMRRHSLTPHPWAAFSIASRKTPVRNRQETGREGEGTGSWMRYRGSRHTRGPRERGREPRKGGEISARECERCWNALAHAFFFLKQPSPRLLDTVDETLMPSIYMYLQCMTGVLGRSREAEKGRGHMRETKVGERSI